MAQASVWKASQGARCLAIFGPERYPVIMGRIAMPSLIAQAAAPSVGALILEVGGLDGALAAFLTAAAFNAFLVVGLFLMLLGSSSPRSVAIQ